jgi:hypothetical protein
MKYLYFLKNRNSIKQWVPNWQGLFYVALSSGLLPGVF